MYVRESRAMQTMMHHAPAMRIDRMREQVLFGISYPFFLVVEGAQRAIASKISDQAEKPMRRSAFAEARVNTLIAISYAFMARSTLRKFAR